jgi:hypothetical protein
MSGFFQKQSFCLILLFFIIFPTSSFAQDCFGQNIECMNYTPSRSTFDCIGYIGTCKKPAPHPEGVLGCDTFIKKVNGKDAHFVYCKFFQCDGDNVRVNSGPPPKNPPNITHAGGAVSIGKVIGDDYVCYANCCYLNSTHKFLTEFNFQTQCRNICCPTLEGYLAGDCSKDAETTPVPTPGATPIPVQTAIPEITPGDGIVQSEDMKDFQIGFGE